MEEHKPKKEANVTGWMWLMTGIGIGGICVALFFGLSKRIQPAPIVIEAAQPLASPTPQPPTATPSPLTVFVNGEVTSPGVYELEPNGRVQQAIEAAGGFTGEANTAVVNLALPLSDGAQLYVPSQEDTAALLPDVVETSRTTALDLGLEVVEEETAVDNSNGLININTADAIDLDRLPGIGPSTAGKIIAYREANGAFPTVEAIMNVHGIGEAKFNSMKELITVGE